MVSNKIHTLNLALQAAKIRSLFPLSQLSVNRNRLVWRHTITPSALSASYDVELIYVRDEHPNVYVVSPKLELYPGEVKLPHVYDTEKQWLCLYYRRSREWKSNMFLTDTVIPWTCEWLLHYEFWLTTGVWHGGGIEHISEAKKIQSDNETERENTKPR